MLTCPKWHYTADMQKAPSAGHDKNIRFLGSSLPHRQSPAAKERQSVRFPGTEGFEEESGKRPECSGAGEGVQEAIIVRGQRASV